MLKSVFFFHQLSDKFYVKHDVKAYFVVLSLLSDSLNILRYSASEHGGLIYLPWVIDVYDRSTFHKIVRFFLKRRYLNHQLL